MLPGAVEDGTLLTELHHYWVALLLQTGVPFGADVAGRNEPSSSFDSFFSAPVRNPCSKDVPTKM